MKNNLLKIKKMTHNILFYDKKDLYGEFSNFYELEIEYGGILYPTSEHAYQAQKYIHSPQYMEIVKNCDTPAKVYAVAKQKKNRFGSTWYVNKKVYGELKIDEVINWSKENGITLREDWETVKDNIMRDIVYQKFTQNTKLRILLINTCNKILIENSPTDYYWGIGKNGTGKNMLGTILMEIRYTLFNQLPHNNSDFLTSDHRIVVGHILNNDDIQNINNYGFHLVNNIDVNIIINEYKNGTRIFITDKNIALLFLINFFNMNNNDAQIIINNLKIEF
jgi:predicted NAD-dependent protein-ADP-ribosyltransferase YbiA (DUF1768 family)